MQVSCRIMKFYVERRRKMSTFMCPQGKITFSQPSFNREIDSFPSSVITLVLTFLRLMTECMKYYV